MEVNLKSTAGRAFNVSFDPITVSSLLTLVTELGREAGVRQVLLQMREDTRNGKYAADEYAGTYLSHIADLHNLLLTREVPIDTTDLWERGDVEIRPGAIDPSDFAVGAFSEFLAEYKLLQSGAGSERACMDSFWNLCELLQTV